MSDKTDETLTFMPNHSAGNVEPSCDISTTKTSSNLNSVVTVPLNLETLLMPIQVVNSTTDLNERKNLKSHPKQFFIKGKHSKYRLIRKSPMKGSPTKSLNHILRKHRKVKSKGLSPRKLKFILPKITKFSPRKLRQPRLLKSKAIAPAPNELNSGECSESIKITDGPVEMSNQSNEINSEIQDLHEQANKRDLNSIESTEILSADKGNSLSLDGGEDEELEDAIQLQQQEEDYLAAFLKASSTIAFQKSTDRKGSSISTCEQKLSKQQRRLNDRLLALSYVPDINSHQDVLVFSYLMEVMKALSAKNSSLFDEFVSTLKEISDSSHVVPAYYKIMKILEGFPHLQDAFVIFLKPEEALKIGKYSEYLMINSMRTFAEELKEHSKKQPQNLPKVVRVLDSLVSHSNFLNVERVLEALTPILKLQPWLLESLSKCIPTARPQCSLPDDFEEINLDNPSSPNSFELISLPDDEIRGSSDKCPCQCHNSQDSIQMNRLVHNFKSEHCLSCALRFIDGRVFLQCGRTLRLAKVFYDSYEEETKVVPLPNKNRIEGSLKRECKQQPLVPSKASKIAQKTLENLSETEKIVKKGRKSKKS